MQLAFDIFRLNSNLRCNSWADFDCPTSIDVFYWVGATKYTGITDLVLPANGPAGDYRVVVNFSVPAANVPVGAKFKIELAFKMKSGTGNCVQSGTKYVVDDFSLCQITCSNCTIDAKNDVLCSDQAVLTNTVNGNVSLNDVKYTGAVVSYSLANGPFANGSSTVGGATLTVNSNGTYTLVRTDLTKTQFDFTYKMTESPLGLTDLASVSIFFGCGGPLPVRIENFYANRNNNNIAITWKSQTETNVSRYEIQKKVGNDFVTVGVVAASNNSTGSFYSYTDANSSKTISEYRLKIVDQNNTYKYSDIRAVKGIKAGADFTLYPNPSRGTTKVLLSDVTTTSNIRLIDNAGRVVKNINSNSGSSIDMNGLQNGIYIVRMTNEATGETVTKKLVVEN